MMKTWWRNYDVIGQDRILKKSSTSYKFAADYYQKELGRFYKKQKYKTVGH